MSSDQSQLAAKCFDCLGAISGYQNLRIKKYVSDSKFMEVLQIFLKRYERQTHHVARIVSIFNNIHQSPEV